VYQIRFWPELHPEPSWESLQRFSRTPVWFKGPTSKGRIREKKERDRREKGKGREGRGRNGREGEGRK